MYVITLGKMSSFQDWDFIEIGQNRGTSGTSPRTMQTVPRSPTAQHLAKLASATEPVKQKMLSREAVTTIVNYRRANNLTQRHLDQQLAFPPNTINRLEARNVCPTTTQLNALNRILKTGLTLE